MSIGEPLPRIDGPIKVTGAARYTADVHVANMLYGVVVTASIPAGKVTGIDKNSAIAEAGVVRVLTHEDMPRARCTIARPMGCSDLDSSAAATASTLSADVPSRPSTSVTVMWP